MARKKKPADEGGGGANWMDTYGDMVTLLLCFFVLLYAFSNTDTAKFEGLASSLQQAFNSQSGPKAITISGIEMAEVVKNPIDPIAPTSAAGAEEDDTGQQPGSEGNWQGTAELEILAGILEDYISVNSLGGEVVADYLSMTLTIRFEDSIFFDSGKATLRPESYDVLNSMIDMFIEHDEFINTIVVEGHTDNVPLRGGYKDNLELSSIRATEAWRYIYQTGRIDAKRISGMGKGEFHPVASNDTAEGRQANRRVDFVIDSINFEALRAFAGIGQQD